jgi:hypothetical protein
MNFALYLVGFIIVIVGLAWGAMVAGVPQTYIMIGVVVLFGLGILSAVKKTRPKDPPSHTSGGRRADDY